MPIYAHKEASVRPHVAADAVEERSVGHGLPSRLTSGSDENIWNYSISFGYPLT